ncbi:hypothetical protein [Pedobacter sp.]|uniref:hypothetical protein n=1 Tax=Pedobacter sp. TaxID=1411316 RepID=UPI003BA8F89F
MMNSLFQKIKVNCLLGCSSILMMVMLFSATESLAQNTLEFAKITGDGNPTGNGPVISTTVNFLQNTNNPSGNTFASYSPALSATITFTNQQYVSNANAVASLAASVVMGHTGTAADAIYTPNAWNGSPTNNVFTSVNSTAGTGISTTDNYALGVRNFTRAIGVQNTTAKVYVGRMEVTFNRPVTNPIIHVSGLGGRVLALYYSTTLDLNVSQSIATSAISLIMESGTSNFSLAGNSMSNNFSVMDFNGSGSVRIVGTNISKVSFDVFLDGWDGNTNTTNYWSEEDASGDAFGVSFSVSETKPSVTGTVYRDNNGNATIDGGGTGGGVWNTANTLYVNAVGTNGNVVATALVSNFGVFTFPAEGNLIEGQTITFQLNQNQGVVGQPAPPKQLPSGWLRVGESTTSGPNDGTPNGEFTLIIGTANSPNTKHRYLIKTFIFIKR